MSALESKSDLNKDYKTLAHICTIIQSESVEIHDRFDISLKKAPAISRILQLDVNNINYQIPPDSKYYKINNPKLIGYTALHFAVEKRKYKIVQILLSLGANFTIKNNNNETVLHQASQFILENLDNYWGKVGECFEQEKLQYPLVNLLLYSHSFFSNATNPSNSYGISHFHIACLMNNVKVVQLFLENGVPINQAVNSDSLIAPGYTSLHFAVRFFSVEVLQVLIEKGADVSLKDAKNMNPLHLLIKRNIEIIDCISDRKDLKENFEANKKMIELFIKKKLSKGLQTDDIGFSDFHAACTLQDVAFVKKMLDQVSDINHSINKNSPSWAGYTALHFAAHFDMETLQFLLKEGANILIKDHQGVSPLDIVLQKCDVHDFHLIINSQPLWKNILFSDNKTKLIDLIISMHTVDEFESFLSKVPNVNMFVPRSSSLWPGYTPLHLAVLFCNSKNYLMYYKDINYINHYYTNYDRYKKNENNLNPIQICLKLNADVTVQDIYGLTPIHIAFQKKRMDIVDQLLEKQSKICQPVDHKNLSHLHMAFAVTQKVTFTFGNISKAIENAEIEYKRCIASLSSQADTSIALKSKFIALCENPFSSRRSEYPKIIYANVGSTPLHIAVQASNTTLTEKLLTCGFDVNYRDIDGFTPIHQLLVHNSSSNCQALCELLFSRNPKDCVSNCGLNYLHVACYVKNKEAVEKLLDSGSDVNATIAPFSSMDSDELPELQLLLAHQRLTNHAVGSISDHRCINSLALIKLFVNYTPLHFVVEESIYSEANCDIADILLQRGANMLAKKADGSVILYEVLAGVNTRLSQVFIKEIERNGEWQKLVEKDSGITMLHFACELLDLDAVERLLKSTGDANARCHSDSPVWPGCTPLHILLMSSQRQSFWYSDKLLKDKVCAIAKMLLDYGAEITIQNAYHKTPLHQSIQEITYLPYDDHQLYLTKILLKYCNDFNNNPTDDRGITHFHIACMCNEVSYVKLFLEHNVDVNQALDCHFNNYGGYTPLHFSVIHQFEEITRLLLQYNADVNATSLLMETPLHLAFALRPEFRTQQSKTKYLEILLNSGAKVNEKNIWGKTPLEKLLKQMEVDRDYDFVKKEIINIITKYAFCVNVFYSQGDTGFIGSSLCNKESYEEVPQNSVFQAVLKAPDLNGPDFLGRNVIHNVVCAGWWGNEPSTKDYITIIEELTKLGFDIDHCDRRGLTPLHAATENENLSAIESLLIHGANINIANKNVEVAYAYSMRWNEYYELEGNWPIHKTFHRHFNKLSCFNLHLHASNKEMITEVREYYDFDIPKGEDERHEAQVIEEHIRLKNVKIEPYSIPLNDFLCETGVISAFPFMLKSKQETVSKFFREKGEYLRKNFPELTGILYFQYRQALNREALIHPATLSLNVLIDFELPTLCSEHIFKFLTNIELKKLIVTKKFCNPTNAS